MTSRFLILPALCLIGLASAAHSATPHGTPAQFTVSTSVIGPATLTGHGSILPATQHVDDGAMSVVTIEPDPGYLLTAVDAAGCNGVDNSDGTWTIGPIQFDCQIVATFVLDPADVVFQGDLENDIRQVADVGLDIPVNIFGASINWETKATCYGSADSPCDSTFHFRPASSLFVLGHTYLVFRYPTNDDNDLPGTPHSYGIVATINNDDPDDPFAVSQPLISGDAVGPAQYFDYPSSVAGCATWTSPDGVDAYIGFRFINSVSGRINYGYAHMVTQPSSNGFPATITDYAYNRRGDAITIP
ncbi:MAG: hypothetical protein ABI843_05390 [Dokdonella sp.]